MLPIEGDGLVLLGEGVHRVAFFLEDLADEHGGVEHVVQGENHCHDGLRLR